jgi:hypothetical protein
LLFDLPFEQLRDYRPPRDEPSDFDALWAETLTAARAHPLSALFEPVDVGLQTIETFDVKFAGYGGQQRPGRRWRGAAAGAMKPYQRRRAAVGAGQAIEDSCVLATALSILPDDLGAALKLYERSRLPRTAVLRAEERHRTHYTATSNCVSGCNNAGVISGSRP